MLAKAKLVSKELARHTLVKNKHKTLNGGQKKIVFGGPRVKKKKQERLCERQKSTFLKVVSIPTIQRKLQKMIFNRVEDEERLRKENVWKVPK